MVRGGHGGVPSGGQAGKRAGTPVEIQVSLHTATGDMFKDLTILGLSTAL